MRFRNRFAITIWSSKMGGLDFASDKITSFCAISSEIFWEMLQLKWQILYWGLLHVTISRMDSAVKSIVTSIYGQTIKQMVSNIHTYPYKVGFSRKVHYLWWNQHYTKPFFHLWRHCAVVRLNDFFWWVHWLRDGVFLGKTAVKIYLKLHLESNTTALFNMSKSHGKIKKKLSLKCRCQCVLPLFPRNQETTGRKCFRLCGTLSLQIRSYSGAALKIREGLFVVKSGPVTF